MTDMLNTHVLAATRVRSANIGVLGTVIHRMPEPGEYTGKAFQDGVEVLDLRISVDESHPVGHAEIDLSRRKTAFGTERREWACAMRPSGHLVLFSSGGRGGYHVLLYKDGPKGEAAREIFDSRALGAGDLFAVTLMRPGAYAVLDELGKGQGRIRVAPPANDDRHPATDDQAETAPPTPVDIIVTSGNLDPAEIELLPAQPLLFAIVEPSSAISIELVAADDRVLAAQQQRSAPWPTFRPPRAMSVLAALA
jgi:hypothetical protein